MCHKEAINFVYIADLIMYEMTHRTRVKQMEYQVGIGFLWIRCM